MIKKTLKILLINILVFFGLIVSANIISILGYNLYEYYKNNQEYVDNREKTPNYKETEWSKQHFKELRELKAEYQSYIGWRMLNYSGETINIDEDGLRNTPQHKYVDEESLLVCFLGGSTTWGVGANDKNTIPALFSEKGMGKYKTQNFGEHSYRAYQSYLFLDSKIKEGIIPNIVISYDGVNEKAGFTDNHKPSSHSREDQIRKLLKGQDNNKYEKDIMSLERFFLGPLKVISSRIIERNSPVTTDYNLNERAEQVAKALLDSWLSTKLLAEENDALFFCVLQPNALIGSPNLEHLNINPERKDMYNQLYSKVFKLLETEKYKVLSDHFIDLTNALDGVEKYYIDFCHLSPNGNKVIADNLLLEIEKKIEQLEHNDNE